MHDLVHVVRDGVHLAIAAAAHDGDVVGVAGPARHVDEHGQQRLLGQRRVDGGTGRGQCLALRLRDCSKPASSVPRGAPAQERRPLPAAALGPARRPGLPEVLGALLFVLGAGFFFTCRNRSKAKRQPQSKSEDPTW